MESGTHARSRLLGSSDRESLVSFGAINDNVSDGQYPSNNSHRSKQLKNIFSDNIYITDSWHNVNYIAHGFDLTQDGSSGAANQTTSWRLKERMKTVGVALVICLNIGIDPPDIPKPNPCARKECWYDITLTGPSSKQKGLEHIGNELQKQYEKWQSKAKYKQCLDPTSEELRRLCINLRKSSKGDRLLLHYNGHGVPKPTKNGELWVFGKHYTHYTPVSLLDLRSWIGDPAIYVLDCSGAGVLIPHLVDSATLQSSVPSNPTNAFEMNGGGNNRAPSMPNLNQLSGVDGPTIVLAACRANEILPMNPLYPADIFTSCLTTPITIAIRWFILQNPYSMGDINPDFAETIPGKDNDRKTPRGELNWIFTAITDTIAWNTLPSKIFQKMFRQDLLVASLFRNFLLAKRIMKSFNCFPQSSPPLPDSTTHSLWQSWDLTLESFIIHNAALVKGTMMTDPKNNMSFAMSSNLSFFTDQLTAFELWLDFGLPSSVPPSHLPIVLQVLLSQTHRLRALQLLKRYLALGPDAVNLSLMVGIYPYILKLLQSPADDIKQILVSIWASIIGFDSTCRLDLVREKSQTYFIQCITSKGMPAGHRCMAAFVLAEICNQFKEGQQTCLQQGLHRSCTSILAQNEISSTNSLKKWTCLCLYKLCEDFLWAKYLCITEAGHTHLYPLLNDVDPTVRCSAVLALGEIFGASSLSISLASTNSNSNGNIPRLNQSSSLFNEEGSRNMTVNPSFEEKDLREAEIQLALQILECCTDGSIIVRLESLYALAKFFIQDAHLDCVKIVAKAINKRILEKRASQSGDNSHKSLSPQPSTYEQSPLFGSSKLNILYPWHLSPSESADITAQVEDYLDAKGVLQSKNDNLNNKKQESSDSLNEMERIWNQTHNNNNNNNNNNITSNNGVINDVSEKENGSDQINKQTLASSSTPALSTLMASAYVRLWLALIEVQAKDPCHAITNAVAVIRNRVNMSILLDEKNSQTQQKIIPIPIRAGEMKINNPNTLNSASSDSTDLNSLAPPLSPLGIVSSPSARMNKGLKGNVGGGKSLPRPSPFLNNNNSASIDENESSKSHMSIQRTISPSITQKPFGTTSVTHTTPSSDLLDQIDPNTLFNFPFISSFYNITKQLLLSPEVGYDSYSDPLSVEGMNRMFRNVKLSEILSYEDYLNILFRDYNDSEYMHPSSLIDQRPSSLKSKNGLNDSQFSLGGSNHDVDTLKLNGIGPGSTPPSNIKFEQKAILNIETSMMTSLVMFHAFQDILTISDGTSVSVWSLNSCTRVLEISNKHTLNKANEIVPVGIDSNPLFVPMYKPQITSMQWINESYDSLLMLGSDDGVVKIWRDSAFSDVHPTSSSNSNTNHGNQTATGNTTPHIINHSSSSYGHNHNISNSIYANYLPGIELATAFSALPDVAETSRGSGVILSWNQPTGTLVAGGNSSTIRIWDLGQEQCVRMFHTGVETCLTAIASKSVSRRFSSSSLYLNNDNNDSNSILSNTTNGMLSDLENNPLSWTFAGFADGSIGVFDERHHINGGKVHSTRDHNSWIISAHLRADLPEVITSSVRGAVKFWDLRMMRSFKTLEVQKSALTAFSIHNCAPIMATGSHAQFIKILTLSGEQLGNIIKYHDGFLGQRIGPVSSVAFHPYKMLLAAGATDSIVSIYAAGNDGLNNN
eukprot:gene6077-8370_t